MSPRNFNNSVWLHGIATTWRPPRGVRMVDGKFRWTIEGRIEVGHFDSEVERDAVVAYLGLVTTLVAARKAQGFTVAQLSAATGVSISALSGMEKGSAWPRLSTMRRVAARLGLRLVVDGEEDLAAVFKRQTKANIKANNARFKNSWMPVGPDGLDVISIVGIDQMTLYNMDKRDPRMSTVIPVAQVLDKAVVLEPVVDR